MTLRKAILTESLDLLKDGFREGLVVTSRLSARRAFGPMRAKDDIHQELETELTAAREARDAQ